MTKKEPKKDKLWAEPWTNIQYTNLFPEDEKWG